jgi:hypothetical protein
MEAWERAMQCAPSAPNVATRVPQHQYTPEAGSITKSTDKDAFMA